MKRLMLLLISIFTVNLFAQDELKERTNNLIERIKIRFTELDKIKREQRMRALKEILHRIKRDSVVEPMCKEYLIREIEKQK